MLRTINLFLLLVLAFDSAYSRPALDSEDSSDEAALCYSLSCPRGTTICGKTSEVSKDDKQKLDVVIKCYDEDGNILNSRNTTEKNPFPPNVYYKGTKISAVVKLSPGGDSAGNEEGKHEYLQPSYPVGQSGPKSEVEDLNN